MDIINETLANLTIAVNTTISKNATIEMIEEIINENLPVAGGTSANSSTTEKIPVTTEKDFFVGLMFNFLIIQGEMVDHFNFFFNIKTSLHISNETLLH